MDSENSTAYYDLSVRTVKELLYLFYVAGKVCVGFCVSLVSVCNWYPQLGHLNLKMGFCHLL